MVTADSSSKGGSIHWNKMTVQGMQGAMDASGLKDSSSLADRETQRKPLENYVDKQPMVESGGRELQQKIQSDEVKEKSGDAQRKETSFESTEPEMTTIVVVSPAQVKNAPENPNSDLERRQRRVERFGVSIQMSEEEKQRVRAASYRSAGSFVLPVDPKDRDTWAHDEDRLAYSSDTTLIFKDAFEVRDKEWWQYMCRGYVTQWARMYPQQSDVMFYAHTLGEIVDLAPLIIRFRNTQGVPSIVLEDKAFEVGGVGFSRLILGFFSNPVFLPFNLTWMQEAPRLLPNSDSGWIHAGKVSPLLRLCCCFCLLDHNVTITIRRGSFCIVRPRSCGSGI